MATSHCTINSNVPSTAVRRVGHRAPLAAVALAIAAAFAAAPASAWQTGRVDLVTRADGRVLPVYDKDGRQWVVGTPGQEYAIRVCNTTRGRVLAVMSVDGVNILSGDTASPSQGGYVLDGGECADINGWRKNQSSVAAFYFTELPDSYAARTGRPDNVGVIGVAFFRERPQPIAWKDAPSFATPRSRSESQSRGDAAAGNAQAEGGVDTAQKAQAEAANSAPAPAPLAKIGTGHGRNERSYVATTTFERASATPDQTIAIQYDRRENLIAMGILPPPSMARTSNPFPAWTPRYVPDPPQR